jgi:hypothetical protein
MKTTRTYKVTNDTDTFTAFVEAYGRGDALKRAAKQNPALDGQWLICIEAD